MRYSELFIGFRYLFAPRREKFISLITFLSFIGIVLGVLSLIVVMSIMNGFKEELMNQMIGVRGHVLVQGFNTINNYSEINQKLIEHPNVVLSLPTIEQATIASHKDQFKGIIVHAHDPNLLKKHRFFQEKILSGTINALNKPDTIILGSRLAESLNLHLGDRLTLIDPKGEETILGNIPKYRDFEIVGIFELGMREYDKTFIFTSLESAQSFFGFDKSITHIDVFTNPTENISKELYRYLKDPNLRIVEWQHADSNLFRALNIEKNVMFIILTLMILIAVLNIVSSLVMLVKDKNRDIAILRSIGLPKMGILKIFFLNGALIGIGGTFFGLVFGILFTLNIEKIRLFLENIFKVTLFNPEVYYLSHLPASLSLKDVIFVCSISLFFSFIATLYPAAKAATLDPGKVLR